MRRSIWPICATLLLSGTLWAGSGRAQSEGTGLAPLGNRGESGDAAATPRMAASSAAERAVWDFVHFTGPAEMVDVIDAFDDDDPFDLNLSIGYIRTLRRAKIGRECRNPELCFVGRDDAAGREFIDTVDLMRYTQETHILDMLLTIGLYHDLNVYFRCPLILLDTRNLEREAGVGEATADGIIGGLFDLPFQSPERSGVDYFSFGMSWAPFNQQRDPTEPNWVLNFEGRFGVGDLLRAGRHGEDNGGVSRGVNEIRFGMFLSRRYRWLEPYTGLTAMIGIPKYDTGHHFKDPLDGQINTLPPIEGTLLAGLEIIPWENLERFQKLSIGVEISATFHSEGRTYSELFDALGTTDDPRLDYSGSERFSTSWRDRFQRYGYAWDGMTDIENYATFAGRLTFMIQPAKYVKFLAGLGFAHDQEHFITFTDECNSEVSGACIDYNDGGTPGNPVDDSYDFGPQYNPMTRDVIDAPGNRFRVQETSVFDVFLSVVAMF